MGSKEVVGKEINDSTSQDPQPVLRCSLSGALEGAQEVLSADLSRSLVTGIAKNLIEARLQADLFGGLVPVFGELALEHFDFDGRFDHFEATLERQHLGASTFLVRICFYQGTRPVSCAVLGGALVFALDRG